MNCDVLNIKLINNTVYKQSVTLFDQETANTIIKTPKYGRLYNWFAASNPNFAPQGWHVPSATELSDLITYLGGNTAAGPKVRDADNQYWANQSPGVFPPNNNSSRFSLRGSGLRNSGTFQDLGYIVNLFATTQINATIAYQAGTWWTYSDVFTIGGQLKKNGNGVRLIKDTQDWGEGETLTDLDGTVYPTIKIGNQVWLAANWCCTKLNDGSAIPNVTLSALWTSLTTLAYCDYDNDETNTFDIVNYVTVVNSQNDTLTNTQLYNSVKTKPMLVNRIVFSSTNSVQKYNSLKCVKKTITGEQVDYNVNFYEYVNPLYPNNVIEIRLKKPVLINAQEFLAIDLEPNSETSVLLEFCQETTENIVHELLKRNSDKGLLAYNKDNIKIITIDNKQQAGINPFPVILLIIAAFLAYKYFKK
jgi:uncharacterized protein (TIGR02145 family)